MNLLDLNLFELSEKIKNKEVTSRQVIEAYFDLIEKKEDDINAFISLDKEGSLKRADEIDERLAKGEELGLLAGIPISVKDNIMTKDFKTSGGSKMLENFISPYNASVVDRILEEDGIIIGKTNMDEFAMGNTTEKSYYGPTKNPLDLSLVPGGSSGGSAASVAGQEALVSLASDSGGSSRQPAAYCGLVGFKPSYGRVSRYGLMALSNSLDSIGIIGRNVLDTAYMYSVIGGRDEKDHTSIEGDSFTIDELDRDMDLKGLRIALPKQFLVRDGEREVKTEFSKSIKFLEEAGVIIEEVDMPSLDYLLETYTIISSGDLSSNMARYDGIRYGHRAEDYKDLDELYMNSRSQGLGEEVKKRILFGTYLLSGDRGRQYYDRALKVRRLILNNLDKVYENYDLILTLTSPMEANKLGAIRNEEYSKTESLYNVLANIGGLCAITIPSKDRKTVGLQFIGNRNQDKELLEAALSYERMIG